MLTIIMYHYVRDLRGSRYPKIRGLDTEIFDAQLNSILRDYTVCSTAQVIAAVRGEEQLPPHPCLLTFDDGFIDHYLTVFPRLNERGIVGSFYPSVRPVREHKVLGVHKIHFIFAAAGDYHRLNQRIFDLLKNYRADYDIPEDPELFRLYSRQGRLDPPEVMLVKGILQQGLAEEVRVEILDKLFKEYVSDDEESFAKELYMDMGHLRCMARNGMTIGGHGDRHLPLQTLPEDVQRDDIQSTAEFLGEIYDRTPKDWVMCYPWGTYNDVTISLLKKAHCALGLAYGGRRPRDLSKPFELTRLDAADLR